MGWILDIIIIVLAIVYAVIGSKRGFVRTVIELVGYIAVLAIAFSLSTPFSDLVYDGAISKRVETVVVEALDEASQDSELVSAEQMFKKLPESVTNLLAMGDITAQKVDDAMSEYSQVTSTNVAKAVTKLVAVPVKLIIKTVFIIAVLVIGMVLIRLAARFLNAIASHLPLVSGLNKVLGTLVGFAKGCTVAIVLANLLALLLTLAANGILGITGEDINSTVLFKHICAILM